MKKTKAAKRKGFTLFEMLTAIAVLALLGVMITVGTNLATQSLNKSMYISNASLLSDTVNKAMSDVLRYSVPSDGQDFEEANNIKFSCDIYSVDNGNFTIDEDGLILLDFGNTKIHEGGEDVAKSPALLINAGTYTGLTISDLKIKYNDTDKIYNASYTIKSNELKLSRDCSFSVKPFDIKYQQGLTEEDINWDNPTDIHRHNLKNWTRYDDKQCFATCSECGQTVYRNHVLSDEDLIQIEELKNTLKTCYAVFEGELSEINCINCGGSVSVSITSNIPHNLEYVQNTGDAAPLQHTVQCKNEGCNYSKQQGHDFVIDSYDKDTHSLICKCGYILEGNHEPNNGAKDIIENKKRGLKCGETTDYEYICKECKQLISIKIESAHPEHKLKLANNDTNGHKVTCDYCSYNTLENHKKTVLKPLSGIIGNDSELYHAYFCDCGYYFEETRERHKYVPTMKYKTNGEVDSGEHENKCKCGDVALADRLDIFKLTTSHRLNDYIPTADKTQHIKACECGYNPDNSKPQAHKPFKWLPIDDTYHAYMCEDCKLEEEGTRATHSMKYDTGFIDIGLHRERCTVCDYDRTLSHTYEKKYNTNNHWDECPCGSKDNTRGHSLSYNQDTTDHWQECSCGYKTDKTGHTWITQNNETEHWQECSVCHYKKDYKTHTIAQDWTTDGSQHWKQCSGCNYRTNIGNHTLNYVNTDATQHWKVCSICNYNTTKENHSESGSYQKSETGHWKLCVCGKEMPKAEHTWGNATEIRGDNTNHKRKCTICNYEKTEAHVRKISKKSEAAIISGDDEHNVTCSLCGKDLGDEQHDFSYTSTGNKQHTRTCACGYSDNKNHTVSSWTSVDGSKHRGTCSQCSAIITEDHNFNRDWWQQCGDCGYHK